MAYTSSNIPVGTKYSSLTTVSDTVLRPRSDGRNRSWVQAQCECGSEPKFYVVSSLKSGNTTSCGCVHRAKVSAVFKTHGATGTKLYKTWKGMRSRCLDANAQNYKWYGGKGVSVLPEWEDFAVFRDWSEAAGYADGLELDRIDSDKNYEPNNCRWVTKKKNIRNRDHVWDDDLDAKLIGYAVENSINPYEVIRIALERFLAVE